jgi:hypothetical protein
MNQELTPLDNTKTVRHQNFGRTGSQIWEATSQDGRFTYKRLEDTGTPWLVIDNNTGSEFIWHGSGENEWFGTLKSARRATAKLSNGTLN